MWPWSTTRPSARSRSRSGSSTDASRAAQASSPLAAVAGSGPIAVSKVGSAAPDARKPERALAGELRQARQRIAELGAELELHQAAARAMLWRIEAVVGRRAA